MNTTDTFSLGNHARIWIYQSNRTLSESEIALLEARLEAFISTWSAHGAALLAEAAVLHSRFVVLAVDEAKALASGCSIDKSVHLMKALGQEMNIDFFDRMQTSYIKYDQLETVGLHQFWALRKAGLVGDDTLVFDNLVKTLGEFRTKWLVPFSQSWHAEMWK